jgi:hypothetical protein
MVGCNNPLPKQTANLPPGQKVRIAPKSKYCQECASKGRDPNACQIQHAVTLPAGPRPRFPEPHYGLIAARQIRKEAHLLAAETDHDYRAAMRWLTGLEYQGRHWIMATHAVDFKAAARELGIFRGRCTRWPRVRGWCFGLSEALPADHPDRFNAPSGPRSADEDEELEDMGYDEGRE